VLEPGRRTLGNADPLAEFAVWMSYAPKWWVPDDVVFVDAIPLGATGKMQKNVLRDRFRDHKLPGV
jgi:acyl-CoA synthetase (AMP-forming)/AMP-acid ligase II